MVVIDMVVTISYNHLSVSSLTQETHTPLQYCRNLLPLRLPRPAEDSKFKFTTRYDMANSKLVSTKYLLRLRRQEEYASCVFYKGTSRLRHCPPAKH